jgi:hypothetical protein
MYRDMNSWQTKFGSFCANWKAAALAFSIKASLGVSERAGASSADGSGHGGSSGCAPRFNVGASEQGGVLLWAGWDWAVAGVVKASAKAIAAAGKLSHKHVC